MSIAVVFMIVFGVAFCRAVAPVCTDRSDCTDALQALLDNSTVQSIALLRHASPYISKPLFLRRSNVSITCESGSMLLAKRWSFNGTGDSLLSVSDVNGFVLDGCNLRMWREDYANHNWYRKGEWRMALNLNEVSNVIIRNSLLEESGGDGIYLSSRNKPGSCSRNVLIDNVTSRNNYRQGISVICSDGLLVQNSVFEGTRGTNPQCGVDIEPNYHTQQVVRTTFRNVTFRNNSGCQISVSTYALTNESMKHSVVFENIRAEDTPGYGIILNVPHDHLPEGSTVQFNHLHLENSAKFGIFALSANLTHGIVFSDTTLTNVSYGHVDSISDIAIYIDHCRNLVLGYKQSPLSIMASNQTGLEKRTMAIYMQGSPHPPSWGAVNLTGNLVVSAPSRYNCIVEGPKDVKENFNVSCRV